MKNIIRFSEENVDGCGGYADCFVEVDVELTNGDKERLLQIINELKLEDEDWDTDSLVKEACQKYFTKMKIPYEFIGVDTISF